MDEPVAVRNAVANAVRNNRDVSRVTRSATPKRAQRGPTRKRDTLRYLRAGAIWTALPVRDQRLLLWLLGADVVTAQLAALLVYGQLRTAQRRLARLSEYGLVTGFWAAGVQRPRGRYAYALTPAARVDIERLVWPDGRAQRAIALPPSPPIHQLASHDVLAAFLTRADEPRGEGLFAWIPERPAGELLGGYVRPDAIAGVRVGERAIVLFIERDLGTERGDVLPGKIRRYRSLFGGRSPIALSVGLLSFALTSNSAETSRPGRWFMEFLVHIEVRWPPDGDPAELARLTEAERMRGAELVVDGTIRRMWRIPGRWANWGIWVAPDATGAHLALASLPLFRWLDIEVHPLAAHPTDPGPG